MTKVNIKDLEIDQRVYYVANHLEATAKNAEEGFVTMIKDNKVWVRFRGPTGELTPVNNIYT